jgi:alanyl-tRNA synthetase
MFPAFFAERGHAILPSASLIPGGDPSVLFTTAGVQPLLPYLLVRPTRRQPPRRRRARRYGVRRQLARHGIPAERIVYLGEEHNWWTLGPEGPRGLVNAVTPNVYLVPATAGASWRSGTTCS